VLYGATSAALLGGLAVALDDVILVPAIVVWLFSGFGVGAAQWLLMRGRLDVSFRWWTVSTGCGAIAAIFAQFYLGLPFFKAGLDFPDLISRFGYDVVVFGAATLVAGGLALGVPQMAALSNTDVRWRTWLLVTALGILAAWLASLGLWSTLMDLFGIPGGHWPRPIRIIATVAGYWTAIALPQAFVMGPALKRRARA
jgi:hypothetical protein